jgi:spore photoproduct lyase
MMVQGILNRPTQSGVSKGFFPFIPVRAFFEEAALEYPVGRRIHDYLNDLGVEIQFTGSHNRVTGIPGKTAREAYLQGKRTLVVGIRKTLDFATCKPSADFQLPLVTGCPGKCQYCYLNTTMGKKPYIRVYVNIDQILDQAQTYIDARLPDYTVFEGAATSDPLAVEPFTGSLAAAIAFFGRQEKAGFRFVTKFTNVNPLLKIRHNGKTRFRFSINTESIITAYERGAPGLGQRLEAAYKVAAAGYPLGFIIAPVMLYEGWREEYEELFARLGRLFGALEKLTLEIITHRFTAKAKKIIQDVFPGTNLPLDETQRKFKYGQFGYGKYIYRPGEMEQIKAFIKETIQENIPEAKLEYLV